MRRPSHRGWRPKPLQCPTGLTNSDPEIPLILFFSPLHIHSSPPASALLPEPTSHAPHLRLFPLPGTLFPQIQTWPGPPSNVTATERPARSLLCLKDIQTPLRSCLVLYFLFSTYLHVIKLYLHIHKNKQKSYVRIHKKTLFMYAK